MRFTPSANWTSIANGSNRVVTWTVSIKKTSSLSEALSAGTWIDVTSYISEMPSITQRIEYELGQFSSDSLSFAARNIDWWEANVFNATDYIELKITATLGRGSTVTTDTFYAFSGFIDKANVEYNELADTVSFTAYTADELANRLSALNLCTQYIVDDFNGTTQGLALLSIPGVYVVDADVASYQMKVGLHTLVYDPDTTQINFDGGANANLIDGSLTLTSEDGLEKIELYVVSSELDNPDVAQTEYIIVTTAGDTLPNQPYAGHSLKRYLESIYSKIGITSVTLDSLTLDTHDGSLKFSYYDIPPNDGAYVGRKNAMVSNGTDIFLCVGKSLFLRDTATQNYTELATFTSGSGLTIVKRLFYNSRNNDVWLFYTNAANGDCVRRYDVSDDTISAEIVLSATPNTVNIYNLSIVDDNYTGSDYIYGLMAGIAGTKTVKFVDASTDTVSTVVTMAYDIVASEHDFHYQKASDDFYFKCKDGGTNYYNRIQITSGGLWSDAGTLVVTGYDNIYSAAYHASEDRIYYFVNSGGTNYLKSHPHNNGTVTTVITFASGITFDAVTHISYQNSKIYLVVGEASFNPTTGTLYDVSANAVNDTHDGTYLEYTPLVYLTDRLYGIDILGRLFQLHDEINMYVKQYAPDGTIKGVLNQVLQAYNLIGTISAHKKAFVYRRGNNSGTIQTTGNNLSITTSNTSDILKVEKAFPAISWVRVTSGDTVFSYDGTTYNAGILADAKTLQISNDLIPNNIIQDLAKYFFAFYNTAHDKYAFTVDTANMNYEVMDGCSVVFSTTKIAQTATGLITAQMLNDDGSMILEVIF